MSLYILSNLNIRMLKILGVASLGGLPGGVNLLVSAAPQRAFRRLDSVALNADASPP
jgi:hypothetical protein